MKKQDLLLRIVSVLLLLLMVFCGVDLIRQGAHTGGVLAIFSTGWFTSIAAFTVLALVIAAFLFWALIHPQSLRERILDKKKDRVSFVGRVLIVAGAALPAALLLGPTGEYLFRPGYRLLFFSISALMIAYLLPSTRSKLWKRLLIGAVFTAGMYGIALRFVYVTDYPFKLGWSEGNRLWDYSLYYFRNEYPIAGNFVLPNYLTPGRHGLWGLPFLISGISITWARLWDALLWFVPNLLLGYALFRPSRVRLDRLSRTALILLTFLFLNQGPIYAPLVISALILMVGWDPKRPVRSLIITAVACLYAGLSRWTWLVAPAIWAALLSLLDLNTDLDQAWWRRLRWPAAYAVTGLAGGVLSQLVSNLLFPKPGLISSTTLSQPLLWYRLFPNPTYPEGVILALVLAVFPIFALLVWAFVTGRIRWDWLQLLGAGGALAVTLIVGLVISVKIGGGNNLHNLDMFLISLLLIAAAGFRASQQAEMESPTISIYVYLLAGLLVLIPAWHVLKAGGPLQLPSEEVVHNSLRDIEDVVYARAFEGEVLFLDQRQLVTFGNIEDVPLVMEHELKDLTNRAMSGDPALFADYYADLEAQRFSLIITGHLPTDYSVAGHPFGEEDNAQFEFIYEPMFANYEVVRRYEDVGVWLLEPVPSPSR